MTYTHVYDPDTDFDRHYTRATGERIRRWFRPGDRVLELGCATGLMTTYFAGRDVQIDSVDVATDFLDVARSRGLAGVTFHEADVYAYDPERRYHHVTAAHLINELPDPLGLLRRCRALLEPGGLVHVSLTNPRSIHRLVALELGMIDDVHALSARGEQLATKRIFDADELVALAREAGLHCVHREGVVLKPLTNEQLGDLPDEVIEGLDRVARHFPDHGALNYAIFVADA